MTRFDTTSYFDARAPRYQAALRQCPSARVLDLLPYTGALRAAHLDVRSDILVCDAFGGTGFLARALRHSGFKFVVCDASHEMLAGVAGEENVKTHLTPDDFQSALQAFGSQSFDLVVCHGGLHHVVEAQGHEVDRDASRLRQQLVVSRLARLVAPRGVLIIADIPNEPPAEIIGQVQASMLDYAYLCSLLGEHSMELVVQALDLGKSERYSVDSVCRRIMSRLSSSVDFPVPRWFFDEFVANSPMGHVAAYPDFDQIDEVAISVGLRSLGRINYAGPWLFQSAEEAGWFFREKFSVGRASKLGDDPNSEQDMYEILRRCLGVRQARQIVAVNWGVTYAVYSWGVPS